MLGREGRPLKGRPSCVLEHTISNSSGLSISSSNRILVPGSFPLARFSLTRRRSFSVRGQPGGLGQCLSVLLLTMNKKRKRPFLRFLGMHPILGLLMESQNEVSTYDPESQRPAAIVQKHTTKRSRLFVGNLICRSRSERASA